MNPTREQIAQAIHDSIQREDPLAYVGPCYDQADVVLALFGDLERELRVLFMLAITHNADKPQCDCVACIGLRKLRERTRA